MRDVSDVRYGGPPWPDTPVPQNPHTVCVFLSIHLFSVRARRAHPTKEVYIMSNKSIVPATVKNKIIGAFSESMRGALDHTSFIHTVCVAVGEDYPDAPVPTNAQRELVEGLIEANSHWAERTGQERGREARAIMDTHYVLESYCDAVKADKRAGTSFTWHNGVKVARKIRSLSGKLKNGGVKLPTLKAVCNAYYKASEQAASDPGLTVLNSVIKNLDPRSNLYKELVQVFEKYEYCIE